MKPVASFAYSSSDSTKMIPQPVSGTQCLGLEYEAQECILKAFAPATEARILNAKARGPITNPTPNVTIDPFRQTDCLGVECTQVQPSKAQVYAQSKLKDPTEFPEGWRPNCRQLKQGFTMFHLQIKPNVRRTLSPKTKISWFKFERVVLLLSSSRTAVYVPLCRSRMTALQIGPYTAPHIKPHRARMMALQIRPYDGSSV